MDFSIKRLFTPKTEPIHVEYTNLTLEAAKNKWFNRVLCGFISSITGKRFVPLKVNDSSVLVRIDTLANALGISQERLGKQKNVQSLVDEKVAEGFAHEKVEKIKDAIGNELSAEDYGPILQQMMDIYRVSFSPVCNSALEGHSFAISTLPLGETEHKILVVDVKGLKKPCLYLYGKELGSGNFGQVVQVIPLLTEEILNGRMEVIKIVQSESLREIMNRMQKLVPEDPDFLALKEMRDKECELLVKAQESLFNESRVLALLHKAGGEIEGIQSLVMSAGEKKDRGEARFGATDIYDGGSLEGFVQKRGPLQPNEVVSIFSQLFSGLAYAHSQGVVHGDIKRPNILMQKGTPPVAVLADWGGSGIVRKGQFKSVDVWSPGWLILDDNKKASQIKSHIKALEKKIAELKKNNGPSDEIEAIEKARDNLCEAYGMLKKKLDVYALCLTILTEVSWSIAPEYRAYLKEKIMAKGISSKEAEKAIAVLEQEGINSLLKNFIGAKNNQLVSKDLFDNLQKKLSNHIALAVLQVFLDEENDQGMEFVKEALQKNGLSEEAADCICEVTQGEEVYELLFNPEGSAAENELQADGILAQLRLKALELPNAEDIFEALQES